MEQLHVPPEFAMQFFPESWPSVAKFGWFLGPPFELNRDIMIGTNAAQGHLEKFTVLASLALKQANSSRPTG
jgi:hypothetical protein